MKKILVVGLISTVFSAGAFAAACSATAAAAGAVLTTAGSATAPAAGEICVCDGATPTKVAVNGGSGTVIPTPMFAKNGFDVQCSSNTIVSYNENTATLFAVGGGSRKGNQSVQGSSAGGAVTTSAKCASTSGCAFGDVSTALTAAITAAGS
ncbi:MAG: hypothetical protein M0P95_01310 [Sulfuritalea sp.]|jgi:hypothetical protein|nr:hypothetical protein [Sulfuritalea sp.]